MNLTRSAREYGLDLLKAVSIVFVMLWHLQLFRVHMSTEDMLPGVLVIFLNIFYNISLTAVPIFYLVSLFLFYSKHADDPVYFRYRLRRVFTLFLFWVGIQFFLFYLILKIHFGFFPSFQLTVKLMKGSSNIHSTFYFIMQTIMKGGPRLPISTAGASVFYFLFNMCILTIIAFFYRKIKNTKARQLIGLFIIIISLLYFEFNSLYGNKFTYWRIDNFLIYIPLADLLALNKSKFFKYDKLYFLVFVLFFIQDQLISNTIHTLFPYGRIAIVCGTLTLFCFIYQSNFKYRKAVVFLSTYSLGLFAMHRYCHLVLLPLFQKVFDYVNLSLNTAIPFVPINFFWFIVGVFTIMLTMVLVKLLSLTPLKKFVC